MLCNIIDRRERPYRWREVNVVIEATSHDNCVRDADQMTPTDDDLVYDARDGVSLQDAVAWANGHPGAVTMYIYDRGKGTS